MSDWDLLALAATLGPVVAFGMAEVAHWLLVRRRTRAR